MSRFKILADELAAREGCRLYDVEMIGIGANRTLRVFLDKEPEGVNIDECANVSRALDLRLDVEGLVPGGRYSLEVSSPGIERKLTQPWHYDRCSGKWVQLVCKEPLNPPEGCPHKPTKSLKGQLVGVHEEHLELEVRGYVWRVPRNAIEKGRQVYVDPSLNPKT